MSSPLYTTDSQYSPPPPRVQSKVLVCKWDECPETFIILNDLVSHLHEDHVGRKKANYTCEWASCPRKGATQTSRFALITHLRSHTGEKPYDCKVPGCEKSFTRPDSLTKHMKSQHTEPHKKRSNMEEPQRSYKKRKMSTSPEDDEDSQASLSLTPIRPSHNHNHNNNNNNNNSSSSRSRQQQALRYSLERQRHLQQQSSLRHQHHQPSENILNQNRNYTSDEESSLSEPSESSSSDVPDNNNNNSNINNNINNNNNNEESQQKSFYEKYLVLKAKHRYIRRENELLADEYQVIKKKLKRLRTEKDILLDAVMQQSGIDDDDGDGDGDADT